MGKIIQVKIAGEMTFKILVWSKIITKHISKMSFIASKIFLSVN